MNDLDHAVARWRLDHVEPLAETATSQVYRANNPDHGAVVLKHLKPYGADEILGVRLMQWLDGDGSARIYDVKDQAILMEYVPGETLGDVVRGGGDDAAIDVICDLIPRLHKPRPNPPTLRPLREQFSALLNHDPSIWPMGSQNDFRFAAQLAETMLANGGDTLLHGDFHHDNIMQSDRGWLVIDPKGLIGDPRYETANLFQNPRGAADLAQSPARIDRLATRLADGLGWDRQRILGWAVAHSAISACWNVDAGNDPSFQQKQLPQLISIYLANSTPRH